jgi:Tol biopolymer transport system component
VYVPSGYLIFARSRTLMAQPFDPGKAQLSGDPVPIAQNVNHAGSSSAQFSVSANGVLAYSSGSTGANTQLTWLDRSGKPAGAVSTPGDIVYPMISPDGAKVAFTRFDLQTGIPDIWIHELARGSDSRFTFGPRFNMFSAWSPDGAYIAYMATDADGIHIHRKATSGPGQDEVIDGDSRVKRPLDWSRDGKYIVEDSPPADSKSGSVWLLTLDGEKKARPYLQSEFTQSLPRLSPEGQWVAYFSDESKRPEVFVQSFPKSGGKWQVSVNGGSFPVWSRDGKELYFLGLDGKMMVADVRSVPGKDGPTFERGVPKPLFDIRIAANTTFDVGKDGKFLVPVPAVQPGATPINVVVNWPAALKR